MTREVNEDVMGLERKCGYRISFLGEYQGTDQDGKSKNPSAQ